MDATLASPFAYVRFESGLEILEYIGVAFLVSLPFLIPSLIILSLLCCCASHVSGMHLGFLQHVVP